MKTRSGKSMEKIEPAATLAEPLLSLPDLPPLSPEVMELRQQGIHVHQVSFDPAGEERQRLVCIAGLARLTNSRARRWYWKACQIADWYGGVREVAAVELRAAFDREEAFPRWADFEREAICIPLAELQAQADFRVDYQVQRRGGKVVAVRFSLKQAK